MALKGMILHTLAGGSQHTHRSVGLGGGSVTAGGYGAVLDVDHALFRNADETAGLRHTGEHVFHNSAAFVHYDTGGDVVVDKILHDIGCALAVDFFTAGESEVDVVFRHKTLGDQVVGSGEHRIEGHLGIQRASTPHNTVLNDGGKGRLLPVFLIDRHYIVVGHHHGRFFAGFAGPAQQQRAVGKLIEGANFKDLGVEGGEHIDELLEFCVVFQRMIVVGNGLALDQLRQRMDGGIGIEVDFFIGNGRLCLGFESQSADQNHRKKQRNQS